jgi:hypothetical protein
VNFLLLIRSNSTPTCFGIWLPSVGGRECLVTYLADGNHKPKHVAVELERINNNKNPLLPRALVGHFTTMLQEARCNHQDNTSR